MPIDASIALQGRLPQIESPLNAIANVLKIKGAQQQSQLGELQLAEHQRTADENKAVNSAFSSALGPDGKIDRNRLYSTLATSGYGAKLPVLQKGFADQDKAAAEQKKAEIDAHLKKFEVAGQIMTGVTDQASWERAIAQTAQVFGPEAAAQMPTQYDPALVEQKRIQALGVKDQLEQQGKEIDRKLNAAKFGEEQRHNNATETISVDNNKRSVGASLANAGATREVAAATRDAATIQRNQNTEMKLGDDYRAQSKNFKETADAYKQISSVLDKATTSAAATLAGATKFMKMIDPGSVVRESELGMALAATGVFDRASNYYNTLKSGKVLTASQVADFKNITKQIYSAAATQQKLVDKHFSDVASGYKLRPEMVVQDFGQNSVTEPTTAAGVPPDIAAILQKHGGK